VARPKEERTLVQLVRCSVLAAIVLVFTPLHFQHLQLADVKSVLAARIAQAKGGQMLVSRQLTAEPHLQLAAPAPPTPARKPAAPAAVPKPTGDIQLLIWNTFAPLGPQAQAWALRVAYCESRYHPNSVNSKSGAMGLFQFLPSTWAFTPYASQSPFDPVANTRAALWLYQRDGPSQWSCK
jgi:soluble lytic murein transglycosylase-like protein